MNNIISFQSAESRHSKILAAFLLHIFKFYSHDARH